MKSMPQTYKFLQNSIWGLWHLINLGNNTYLLTMIT